MADRIDLTSVSKFDGRNYQQWRFQMVCALKAKGVFGITSGTEALPSAENVASRTLWYKNDVIAMFTLTAAMEMTQIRELHVVKGNSR